MDFQFHSDSEDNTSTSSDDAIKNIQLEASGVQLQQLHECEIENWVNSLYEFVPLVVVTSSFRTAENYNTMKTFIVNDDIKLLIMYENENGELNVNVVMNTERFNRLVYFIKISPFSKYREKVSLNRIVQFGMINKYCADSLLTLLSTVHLPSLCRLYEMSPIVKINSLGCIMKFAQYLNIITNIEYGSSSLFQPVMDINDVDDECTALSENIRKLIEDLIMRWCRQIEIAINDNESGYTMTNLTTPLTELNFWKYKLNNLKFLLFQLNDHSVIKLYNLLNTTNCAFIDRLSLMKLKLEEAKIVAINNVECLQILEEPCTALAEVKCPTETVKLLPKIFLKISVISNVSQEYCTWNKCEFLIGALSNQLIQSCSNLIDVQNVLLGKAECLALENSINVCKGYKQIFQTAVKCHNNLESTSVYWDVKSNAAFSSINMFIRHCEELKQIHLLTRIFTRKTENDKMKMTVCANPRLNLHKRLMDINKLFHNSLNEFKNMKSLFLLFQNKDWYNAHKRYNDQIDVIQSCIEELLEDVFRFITDAEEALDNLCVFHKYTEFDRVKEVFGKKASLVYEMFLQDLDEMKINGSNFDMMNIWRLFMRKRKLQETYQLLKNSKMWLSGSLPLLKNLNYNFQKTVSLIDKYLIKSFIQWQYKVNAFTIDNLKRPLIAGSPSSFDLFEVNIDKKTIKIFDDIKIWNQLGFIMPTELDLAVKYIPKTMNLYRSVEILLIHYNSLITGLTREEYGLFRDLIKSCKNTIKPAATKLFWNDPEAALERVHGYFTYVTKIENIVNLYKENNLKIVNICRQICKLNFIPAFGSENRRLCDLEQKMNNQRVKMGKSLIDFYNIVCDLLVEVYKCLAPHITKVRNIWMLYVEKIDSLFEDALNVCCESNIDNFGNLVSSTMLENERPLKIKLSLILENNEVKFRSDLFELKSFTSTFFLSILEVVNMIPRIYNTMKLDLFSSKIAYVVCLANEERLLGKQEQVNINVRKTISDILLWMKKTWLQYKHIWETEKNDFINGFRKQNFGAADFNRNIFYYRKTIGKLSEIDKCVTIEFVCIDNSLFCSEVSKICNERISIIFELMEEISLTAINELIAFYQESANSANNCISTDLNILIEKLSHQVVENQRSIMLLDEYLKIFKKYDIPISAIIINSKHQLDNAKKEFQRSFEYCKLKLIYQGRRCKFTENK